MKFGLDWESIQKTSPGSWRQIRSADTPVAMISYSHKGLTGLSQESQAFVSKTISFPAPSPHKERPILINNWEATYFDFKKDKLLELADEAQRVGNRALSFWMMAGLAIAMMTIGPSVTGRSMKKN